MNSPIRRVATLVAFMFTALLAASSIIQFFLADDLRGKPDNRRTLLATYGQPRGTILVDGNPIARSVETQDELKYQRRYPQGQVYSHVTGYFSFMYGSGGGLESAAGDLLSGRSDALFYRRLGDLVTGREPTGVSLGLTIDPDAQKAADDGLGGQRGAVVALDPRTGAILAMVSHPQYDPNSLAGHQSAKVTSSWKSLNNDKTRPMVNRAIAGDLYPPGSVFKVITAASAIESGRYNEGSPVESRARLPLPGTSVPLPNAGGGACNGGSADLTVALQKSCNTAFAAIGMDLGGQALRETAAKFGFTQDVKIPMNVTPSKVGATDGKAEEARAAIGQQSVQVTPLQMAMVAAGVANDGVVMSPYLIKQQVGTDLEVLSENRPEEYGRAIRQETADALTRMMERVVQSGTGTRAQIPGVTVAGKSGTAEHGTTKANPHAWFIAFAPVDDPKVAVAVVVEDGGTAGNEAAGGKIAAPIARDVMKAVIKR